MVSTSRPYAVNLPALRSAVRYAWPRLKPFTSIAVILAALAGIIALSLASVLHEHRKLVGEFTQTTHQQVHASVEALTARMKF